MVSFGTILDPFRPKAVQMLEMASFAIILDAFGPKAAQMVQMVSFGTILDTFGPKAAQMVQPLRRHKRLQATLSAQRVPYRHLQTTPSEVLSLPGLFQQPLPRGPA